MANKRELSELIEQLFTLKTITQTYQQIAANHIRKARNSVVNNRDFITDLLQIFQEVKVAYHGELIRLMKKKRIKGQQKLSLIKRNGKTTVVFLSANAGLYGSIVGKTAAMLTEYLKHNDADVLIIGHLGESLFIQQNPNKKYTYFDFPDNAVDSDQLKKIISHLLKYEKILVFYGQFQSIVSQNPIIAAIDGGTDFDSQESVPTVKYLFEPSLEKIVVFFETEIFGLVFEQAIRESQLAKHASRMFSLDNAIQNINSNLNKTTLERRIIHHRAINTKQLNSLSGISMWSGRNR
jgi:ATP synthase F1 gamma subunit